MAHYVAKFQRGGRTVFESEPFGALHEAQTFIAKRDNLVLASFIVISEVDDARNEIRTHELVKL
jgi:hypothetical protein